MRGDAVDQQQRRRRQAGAAAAAGQRGERWPEQLGNRRPPPAAPARLGRTAAGPCPAAGRGVGSRGASRTRWRVSRNRACASYCRARNSWCTAVTCANCSATTGTTRGGPGDARRRAGRPAGRGSDPRRRSSGSGRRGAGGRTVGSSRAGRRSSGGWAASRVVRPGRARLVHRRCEVVEQCRRPHRGAGRDQLGDDLAQLVHGVPVAAVQRHGDMLASGQDLPDPPGAPRLRPVLEEHPYPVGVGPLDHPDEVDRPDRLCA